jgi:hypothetical protein
MALWLQPVSKRVARASAQRPSPLTAHGPFQSACAVAGTVTEWDYDNDESGTPSVGDVITLAYNNCQDTVGETSNGSFSMNLTQVSAAPVPSGSAQVTFNQMSYVTPRPKFQVGVVTATTASACRS